MEGPTWMQIPPNDLKIITREGDCRSAQHALGENLLLFLCDANERLPWPASKVSIFPVYVARMELSFYCFSKIWSMHLNFFSRILCPADGCNGQGLFCVL
jgi:hypothetical protein